MGGGKGGQQAPSTQTTNTSTYIPPWLEDAAQRTVERGETLSNREYNPYGGDIVAGATADQNQAYQQIRDMQGSVNPAFAQSNAAYQNLLGQAAPITAGGVNDTANQLYGNYNATVMDPARGMFGQYLANGSPATAQQVGNNATQLMSPYTQQVIDPALAAGQQQLALARQGIAGQANNVGAFGGSRQGVTEGVATSQTALGTQKQIGDMLMQGWGQALTPAYNLANNASQQGYNAANALANLGQAGYNNAATQGYNMANQNLASGMTAASQLPAQALQQAAQQQRDAGLLQTAGLAQQQQNQNQLNADMSQYYAEQNWPVQNLDLMTGILGGVPYSTTGTSTATSQQGRQQKNMAMGALGGAASGAAVGAAFGGVGAIPGAVIGGLLGAFG